MATFLSALSVTPNLKMTRFAQKYGTSTRSLSRNNLKREQRSNLPISFPTTVKVRSENHFLQTVPSTRTDVRSRRASQLVDSSRSCARSGLRSRLRSRRLTSTSET